MTGSSGSKLWAMCGEIIFVYLYVWMKNWEFMRNQVGPSFENYITHFTTFVTYFKFSKFVMHLNSRLVIYHLINFYGVNPSDLTFMVWTYQLNSEKYGKT